MSGARITNPDDRLVVLLADRALDGLSPSETRELEAMLSEGDLDFDPGAFDRTAAAISVALMQSESFELPEGLRTKLDVVAERWAESPAMHSQPARPPRSPSPRDTAGRIGPETEVRTSTSFGLLGWLAAAACLAFAAILWSTSAPSIFAPSQATLAKQRDSLIGAAPDLVRIPWTATEDPAASGGIEGEIVWSDSLGKGFMTFTGLASNDPAESQYQLWIFDETRDERYPIDGGVFDIASADGMTIVEVDPRLVVHKAALFAVTVEKPGGVVVSSRERLPALAQVAGG